jgi:hypothetical protein
VLDLEAGWRERTPSGLERLVDGARAGILPRMWSRVADQLVARQRSVLECRADTEATGADAGGIASLRDQGGGRAV